MKFVNFFNDNNMYLVLLYLVLFNNQYHENLYISSFVDMLWDSGEKVNILNLLRENSIVFSFIIRENNILFTETQGKKLWKFCENPEIYKKFNYFYYSGSYDLNVVWKTKKVRSFFPVKDKNLHSSCKIYCVLCSCGKDYIGETKRNFCM